MCYLVFLIESGKVVTDSELQVRQASLSTYDVVRSVVAIDLAVVDVDNEKGFICRSKSLRVG